MRTLAVKALGLAFYVVIWATCAACRLVMDAGRYADSLLEAKRS